jgi:hypothetical protein
MKAGMRILLTPVKLGGLHLLPIPYHATPSIHNFAKYKKALLDKTLALALPFSISISQE